MMLNNDRFFSILISSFLTIVNEVKASLYFMLISLCKMDSAYLECTFYPRKE
jgi:hypothetical protein